MISIKNNMQCILFVLSLLFSLVNSQQSSKCDIPILANDDGVFVAFNFPQRHNKISFTSSPNPSSNFPFEQDIGSIWELSKPKNQIKIKFSSPILISSFAINSCTRQGTTCNRDTTNQIFTLDYQSSNSGTIRLKPFNFQDGIFELSENHGLPTIFVFDKILTDEILITKRGGDDEVVVQLELYGCASLPTNTVSLNKHIQQMSIVPSYTGYERNVMQNVLCNEEACVGSTGVLFDGVISYDPSQIVSSLRWPEKREEYSIQLTLLFNENIQVTNIVIHCNILLNRGLSSCIPEVEIKGVNVLHEHTANISDTLHGMFRLDNNNNNNNKLEITLKINKDPFDVSEIEIFGRENTLPSETETETKVPEMLPIFISSFFFAVTLALIIPLLISVVVICFKIKKQTLYFPVQQNSYYCKQKHFAPKQQQQQQQQRPREQQQQHVHYPSPQIRHPELLNSTLASIDSNLNYTPIDEEFIKRIDTNTLNNMYERIPTISTEQGNFLRDSMKRGRGLESSGRFLTPSPRPKLPEIPIYSVPNKNNKKTVNRPSSHEGYLELRDMSLDDNSPALGEDENPLYDYVRPRSAMINTESNQSLCNPTSEYINVGQPHQEYVNTVNNNTHL